MRVALSVGEGGLDGRRHAQKQLGHANTEMVIRHYYRGNWLLGWLLVRRGAALSLSRQVAHVRLCIPASRYSSPTRSSQ